MSSDPARSRHARRALITGAFAALALMVGAQVASAAPGIFWTNSGTNGIGRADPDGGDVNQAFVTGLANPVGLAGAGRNLYWATGGVAAGSVGHATLDGSDVLPSAFSTTTSFTTGIAVGGGHIYWGSSSTIGRAEMDGGNLNPSLVSSLIAVEQVAVDANHVYWADTGQAQIGRAELNGANANPGFITGGLVSPHGVAVDASHVYWADNQNGKIGRADLSGANPNPDFMTGLVAPGYLAVDAAHIYWTNGARVGRADINGTNKNASFIAGVNPTTGLTVVSAPAAALLPGVGSFPEQLTGSTSASQSFTMSNSGSAALVVESASLTGTDPSEFRVDADTCSGQSVGVGANCVVQVSFAPATAGAKAAILSIPSDDSSSPGAVTLSGMATGDPVVGTPPLPTPEVPALPISPTAPTAPRSTATATQSATKPGSATFTVTVNAAGRLTTRAGARIDGRTIAIYATALSITRAGTFAVTLHLPAKVRARLSAKGRVPITITSVLTTDEGASSRATRSATLRAPASRLLRGQWIGRVMGPWTRAPRFSVTQRSALRFTTLHGRRVAKVVR